ncbi:hypothetical protein V5O48_006934 [Marasmius crinis-equi]|uniref:PXA domain-containing protein n=1 Tax=Marasmius crinis-equi TaxID=585013 RepID=A0ABR3FI27_9AGAR
MVADSAVLNVLSSHKDVRDAIFDQLPVADLVYLARTCSAVKAAVEGYHNVGFSINKLLRPYFTYDEIQQFRMVQAYTGTLISGSTTLQYFARMRYEGSDLDVYVEHRYATIVVEFLQSLGYAFKSPEEGLPLAEALKFGEEEPCEYKLGIKGITSILTFVKGDCSIQIVTAECSAMEVVLNFHSTVVMNVISYSHAYCLFPKATLEERTALICRNAKDEADEARVAARQKYIERGWSMIDFDGTDWATRVPRWQRPKTQLSDAQKNCFNVDRLRHLGDSHCFTIRLPKIPNYYPPSKDIDYSSLPAYRKPPHHVCDELDPQTGYQSLEMNSWTLSSAEIYDPNPPTPSEGSDSSDNEEDEEWEPPARGFPLERYSNGQDDRENVDYRMVYNTRSHIYVERLMYREWEGGLRFGYCIGLELLDKEGQASPTIKEVKDFLATTLLRKVMASANAVRRELKDEFPLYFQLKRYVEEEDQVLKKMKAVGFLPAPMVTRADPERDAVILHEEIIKGLKYVTQAQSSTSLTHRLLFPNGVKRDYNAPDSLPPLFGTTVPPELTGELYDFIALALRAFVLPWWSKITRYDKEFLPQINHILTHVFRSLEERVVSQAFTDELPGLIFEDIPIIITQHYKDFRNAQGKVDSSYASGGSLFLPKLFHQLQPHIAVDAEGKLNHEYIRQIIDHVLRVCLPEEDYGPEAERFIVREIVVKIVVEDVLPKVTKPWFIYRIILDLLDGKARSSPPSPTQITQTRGTTAPGDGTEPSKSAAPSSGPFSSLLILLLSTIQSISGACLALIHAYKQVVITVKQVNASSPSPSDRKLDKTGEGERPASIISIGRLPETEDRGSSFSGTVPLERTQSRGTHRSSLSMPGTPVEVTSISRVSSKNSYEPSTSSAIPNTPTQPARDRSNESTAAKARTPGYAYPAVTLLSEVFTLSERNASRTIAGTIEMLVGALNTEGFIDRLLPHLLHQHALTSKTLLTVICSAKKALFPNGYPQPAPPDPSPEETEEMRRRIITLFSRSGGQGGKSPSKATLNAIHLLLGSNPERTLERALEPLGSQECNMHLITILVDRVVCGIWPELCEG